MSTRPPSPQPPAEGAQSLRRAVAVLRALAGAQDRGARLVDIAAQCELTRPTAHRLLRVLLEEGLAERSPRGTHYVIGRDATLLGIARPSSLPLRTIAAPFLRRVSEASGDSTALTVRSGPDSICVDRCLGSHPIQVMPVVVGARLPLGVGVGGMALLAFLPEWEAEAILRRNQARLARRGLAPADLRARLSQARRLGYAFTEAGVVPGTHVLAVPVFDVDRAPVAALSISAMAARLPLSRARRLLGMLREQARGLGEQHDRATRP